MNDYWLDPLRRILDRSPAPVTFFFRDDNVGRDDERLYAMLEVFAAHKIPIDLGVIPGLLSRSLVKNLQARHVATNGRLALHVLRVGRADRKTPVQLLPEAAPRTAEGHSGAASAERLATLKFPSVTGDPPVDSGLAGGRRAGDPARVDWCRHGVGENTAAQRILGRHVAVVATRRHSMEFILNHSSITGNELVALGELLLLLANHRKAHCGLIRELMESPAANAAVHDATISTPLQLPESATAATRWWRDRVNRISPRVRWLGLAACLGIAVTVGWHWFADAGPSAEFLTARVLRGSIDNTVFSAGTLQPYAYVDVGAQTSGQLKSLHVQVGDRVTRGQLLAEIDPLLSSSKVTQATATLTNLQAQWEGKKAQFELTRLQKSRSESLMRQGVQAASDTEIVEATYRLAHAALRSLDAQISQARAELETAQANLAYTRITAPMDGEVVSITALAGQTLNASQQAPTIMRIAQLDTMTVWALVPEADVSQLTAGQEAYFTILGQAERRWQGRLRQVLPSPQITGNVVFYNALFDVPNPQRELKVQMTAQVFFVLARADDALSVPLSALAQNQSGPAGSPSVRVLDKRGLVETRKVKVGITNAVSAQILSGLKEGDIVITGVAAPDRDHYKPSPLNRVKSR